MDPTTSRPSMSSDDTAPTKIGGFKPGDHDPDIAIFRSGEHVSRYRILEQIGSGGMSEVYLAERNDATDARVALKVLRLVDVTLIRRFDREQSILAKLSHPYIARFYDMGTAASGHPWLTMEYIDGLPVTRWCDQHQYSMRQRLELFVKICEAVSFAHRHLVIHRDIKPDNVMVDSHGVPKLLDFGIAALLDPETGNQQTVTHLGGRMMTPDYASPEQWRGELLTAATDIYSLGVLLFHLLSGTLPFRFSRQSPMEAFKRMAEEETPSLYAHLNRRTEENTRIAADRRLDTQRLRRFLKGEMAAIVGKALSKDPNGRYVSVEAFADDVRRYLSGHVVQARPHTLRYHAGKFVRRNHLALSFVAVLFLVLVGALVAVMVEQRRTEAARLLAEQERHSAEQVTDYLTALFDVADPRRNEGREVTALAMLEIGRKQLAQKGGQSDYVQARLNYTMGKVYLSLTQFKTAEDLLTDALKVFRRDARADYESETLFALVTLYGQMGRLKEMRKMGERLLALAEAQPDDAMLVARAYRALGAVCLNEGAIQTSYEWFQKSLATLTATNQAGPVDFADIHYRISLCFHYLSDLGQAESHQRTALKYLGQMEDPPKAKIFDCQSALSGILRDRGKFDEAAGMAAKVIEGQVALYGENHIATLRSRRIAASIYEMSAQYEAAEKELRTIITHLEARGDSDGETHSHVLDDLSRVLSTNGAYREAEQVSRKALSLLKNNFGDDHPTVARKKMILASHLLDNYRADIAQPLLTEALEVFLSLESGFESELGSTYFYLSGVSRAKGDFERGLEYSRDGRRCFLKRFGNESTYGLLGRQHTANFLLLAGRRREAKAELEAILAEPQDARPAIHRLSLLSEYAVVLATNGFFSEARKRWQGVRTELATLPATESALTQYEIRRAHGRFLFEDGDYQAGLDAIQRAIASFGGNAGPENPKLLVTLGDQVLGQTALGRFEEAEAGLQQMKTRLAQDLLSVELDVDLAYHRARLDWAQGRRDTAAKRYQALIATCRQRFGARHPAWFHLNGELGLLRLSQNKSAAADQLFEAGLQARLQEEEETSIWVAGLRLGRAEAAARRGDFTAAEAHLKQAQPVLENQLQEHHPYRLQAQRVAAHIEAGFGRLQDLAGPRDRNLAHMRSVYAPNTVWVTDAAAYWTLIEKTRDKLRTH